MLDAACPMIISSKVVQPTSWRIFSAVGKYDPMMPRMGLRETIVGTPYLEPTNPVEESIRLPIREPASEMRSASRSPSPGTRSDPATRTRRPTPRLDQSTKKSIPLRILCSAGTGSTPHSGGALILSFTGILTMT